MVIYRISLLQFPIKQFLEIENLDGGKFVERGEIVRVMEMDRVREF